ncbi:hypothetical protein DOTSEDRAFT_53612 [Dothistroma septosporum NZE10]|uniref:SnoaL-like domain-containing protein n=1 Tax=Dothistroma septosporum (strain NZE10 / CBS 128990) TaxID=675120 RepID=N1PNP4_DOTSN|nr:hypothetical protein DOTSEDRAFT_53612 [Dothistroma septosporum NZE10]
MSYPSFLNKLTSREAITDSIHRATIGLDNNDIELCRSAFVTIEEPVFFMGVQGFDVDQMIDSVGSMTTTHHTTNIRIDVKEDANTAVLTAYAPSQHYKAGAGNIPGTAEHVPTGNPSKNLLASSQYVVDVGKDAKDGVWKIRKWVCHILWTHGDF